MFNDVYGLNDVGTLKKTKLGKPAVCNPIYNETDLCRQNYLNISFFMRIIAFWKMV